MKSAFKIALVIVVVALVVSTGFLYATGKLNLNSTSTTIYPSTSPQYNSPNVVSSNQVNNSLGGGWNQTSGSSATATNASSGITTIEGGTSTGPAAKVAVNSYAMPGYSQIVGEMPYLSLQNSISQYTPSTTTSANSSSPFTGMTSFEFAVFQPSKGAGLVTVGYISEKNQTTINRVWSAMNDSAKNSTTANVSKGMTSSGTPYVYGFFKSNMFKHMSNAFNATGMYVNVMISVYSNNLIIILHLANVNTTNASMLTLMNSEITVLKNPSSIPSHPIFITSAQIKNQTGINETNFLQLNINIQNASSIYKDFVNSSNLSTSSSETNYLGEAMSNLSAIGLSTYGDNKGNSTDVVLLKFNNNFNTTIFDGLLSVTNNESKVFSSSTLNGAKYVFYSNSSVYSKTNISVMLFDYKSYVGIIELVNLNGPLVSQSGMKVLLGNEISLL